MLKATFVLITGIMSYYGYHEFPPYKGFSSKDSCEIAGRNFVRPWGGKVLYGKWFPYAGYRCETGTVIDGGQSWIRAKTTDASK